MANATSRWEHFERMSDIGARGLGRDPELLLADGLNARVYQAVRAFLAPAGRRRVARRRLREPRDSRLFPSPAGGRGVGAEGGLQQAKLPATNRGCSVMAMHGDMAGGVSFPQGPGWYTDAMERLVMVVQELSLARSLAAIQDIVRHAARDLARADGATFVLRDGEFCYYADENAIAPLWKGQRFPLSTCISGWVMIHRQPAVIHDIYRDERIPHDVYRPTFVKSLAMVPIRADDPIAAIGVYWARHHQPSGDELRLIQALADTTAVAMENVAVHAELEQRVRERTAEAHAAQQQAEKANLAKTRFFAAASHDLRQPLQAIALMMRSLSKVLDAPSLAWRILRELDAPLRSVNDLLDDLQDVHKLEAGTVEPDIRDFPVQALLDRVRAVTMPLADEKGLLLSSVRCRARVRSDPVLLERIVRNFAINATRYTEAGRILIGCRRRGDELRIEVWDSGCGIAAADLKTVFEEYRQLAGPRHDKGMGLGLSIAQRLAGLLGHRLELRSWPGKGSVFSVSVPLSTATAFTEPPRRPATAPVRTQAASVLVIEDDAAVCEAMRMMLELEGFDVLVAQSPHDALHKAAAAPDIIVSDFHLGAQQTGPQLIGRLRQHFRREIPAIVLTGDVTVVELPGRGKRMHFLHKPVDADALIATLQQLLAEDPAG